MGARKKTVQSPNQKLRILLGYPPVNKHGNWKEHIFVDDFPSCKLSLVGDVPATFDSRRGMPPLRCIFGGLPPGGASFVKAIDLELGHEGPGRATQRIGVAWSLSLASGVYGRNATIYWNMRAVYMLLLQYINIFPQQRKLVGSSA